MSNHIQFARTDSGPSFALPQLLQVIGQFEVGEDFLLYSPPRSVVFHQNSGMYLFTGGAHRPLATFELSGNDALVSVGLRYNEPFTKSSKRRKQPITTGWQGAAELIASAVARSSYFKDLQTVETKCEEISPWDAMYSDADHTFVSTYEVWATPKQSWRVEWKDVTFDMVDPSDGEYYAISPADIVFERNRPVLLAEITVERPVADAYPDTQLEVVTSISIYPQLPWWIDSVFDESFGYVEHCHHYELSGTHLHVALRRGQCGRNPVELLPQGDRGIEYVNGDGWAMNIPPHSEIEMTFR